PVPAARRAGTVDGRPGFQSLSRARGAEPAHREPARQRNFRAGAERQMTGWAVGAPEGGEEDTGIRSRDEDQRSQLAPLLAYRSAPRRAAPREPRARRPRIAGAARHPRD